MGWLAIPVSNWSVSLPDSPFRTPIQTAFATSGETVAYLAAYANFVEAPVRCGVEVTALRPHNGAGFLAETPEGSFEASNVVVATVHLGGSEGDRHRRGEQPERKESCTLAALMFDPNR